MKKVGFFLGSFDPIHNGHLKVIKECLSEHGLDKVVLVLAMHNPFKEHEPKDIVDRQKLISMALVLSNEKYNNFPLWRYCEISLVEMELDPPYYSYKTLEKLNEKYSEYDRYIICGQDTIEKVPKWKNGEQILNDNKFIVCKRTNESSTSVRECVRKRDLDGLNELIPTWLIKEVMSLYGGEDNNENEFWHPVDTEVKQLKDL